MKKVYILLPLLLLASHAQASSGQRARALMNAAERLAEVQALETYGADEALAYNSASKGSLIFVDVGVGYAGRAPRNVNCWIYSATQEDELVLESRLDAVACPEMDSDF